VAVSHHTRERRDFSQPSAVVFPFDLDSERHRRSLPSEASDVWREPGAREARMDPTAGLREEQDAEGTEGADQHGGTGERRRTEAVR
jgi:hypothetical protein